MDDSPRSSKRRKLEAPRRVASSPSTKPSSARKSDRLTTRSVSSRANGVTKKGAGSPLKKTHSAGRLHKHADEKDVWDDIEGALGETTPPKPVALKRTASTRRNTGTSRKEDSTGMSNDTDELQATRRTTPKRGSFKQLVNGEDVLGKRESTNASVKLSKPTSLKKPTRSAARQATSEAEDELSFATPSKVRRKQPRFRDRDTIPETEEEAEPAPAPSPSKSNKKSASARRKWNRVDHTNNRDEEVWVDVSEQEQDEAGVQLEDDAVMSVDGNSIVGSVLDPTEPSPFNQPSAAQTSEPAVPSLIDSLAAGRELDLLKRILLERIAGKRPGPLINLDEEYASVHQLVEHTITAGEGNSMLLIGARGSGKTSLVNKVLSEVSREHGEDFHVVRLNGFIHTDDKIALREIWRQLGKEMDLEEDGGGVGKHYADTLTTLLALLSHPSEQTGEVTDQIAKAVIFVMDEFDLFTQHPRQTLLYNLFDIAQSRKAPIAVLGLTTRIDVANSLEKRVKSRFSHRYIHLSLAKTFTAFQEMCKAILLVQPVQLNVEERGILGTATVRTPAKKGNKGAKSDLLSDWNANINTLFASKAFLTTHLAPTFYLTKSLPQILTSFLLPAATLSPTALLAPSTLVAPPDSKLSLLPQLSTLSLSLLISAARLDIIHDSDTCNFNMVYDEYMTLASKARIQNGIGGMSVGGSMSKVWGKEVARREWEGLVELGFVMPVGGGMTGAFGMVRVDVSLEEIGGVLARREGRGVERGLERWCRQI